MSLMSRILSMGADRKLKQYQARVKRIGDLEPEMQAKSDEQLRALTEEFRLRLAGGSSLDDILDEAFAAVREASVRTLGLRHYDEQLICALNLNDGNISEFKTGEGKTLACTPAVYLNAISGQGVHVVTVNDYLASRDAEQMSNIYNFLGITCSCVTGEMDNAQRRVAYQSDVTYGTNTEFGFDYLRDNMVTEIDARVQRGHHYAIVDEVDSILIDEARTPLIISGQGRESADLYVRFAQAVRGLVRGEDADDPKDFLMDEAKRNIAASEEGLTKIERRTGLDIYADATGALVNHLQQALKAEYLFHRDRDYIVKEGEVLIVDDFTGRILPGRRYSDGLHQAIEAKEGVEVQSENETLATITLQNYFRMYEKLAGMTGTAMTEDSEFRSTYDLPVQVIPSHKPNIRKDHQDVIYLTEDAKFEAIARNVAERHAKGQPVLVGTASIEHSEKLSGILKRHGIAHNVLNAKHHAAEAQIVAQAGRKGAVTIATNMAGRGTDILLGGNPDMLAQMRISAYPLEENQTEVPADVVARIRKETAQVCKLEHEQVKEAGGLCIIGSERHESRRIDNQLRGRSGRQGDPGESVFCLSLEDDLIRLFAGDRAKRVKESLLRSGASPDEELGSKALTKLIEQAQHKVEEVNYTQRKNVLEYDDVMNRQRQVIYQERDRVLEGEDIVSELPDMADQIVTAAMREYVSDENGSLDKDGLLVWIEQLTGYHIVEIQGADDGPDAVREALTSFVTKLSERQTANLGDERANPIARQIMLRVIDIRWRSYLEEMEYLKTGIGLRGFGQRDPLVEYKREAYTGFENLIRALYEDFMRTYLHLEIHTEKDAQPEQEPSTTPTNATMSA